MSYFEDQEEAWLENNCKGNIEDYDPFDPDSWPKEYAKGQLATQTRSQKRRVDRQRAEAEKQTQANGNEVKNAKQS